MGEPSRTSPDDSSGSLSQLVDLVAELVNVESPSTDPAANLASAELVAEIGHRMLGVRPAIIGRGEHHHVLWKFGPTPRLLLLGHHDTVWPIGSHGKSPWSVDTNIGRGPGCFDMKAGVVIALMAAARASSLSEVAILVTGDEELGSPTSRDLIEQEAAGKDACLVFEGAGPGWSVKTARKGYSSYEIVANGIAVHAGLEPEKGVNTTVAIAHVVLSTAALSDRSSGTSVTPTLLTSGSSANSVPDLASLNVDVRAWTAAEQSRVDRAVHEMRLDVPGELIIRGGINRLPMEAAASAPLFALVRRAAQRLGLPELQGVAVGGASDGNITAGLGVATLDGLGATGGGAHSRDEHILLDDLAPRVALAAELIADLTNPSAILADPLSTEAGDRR